MPFSLRPKFVLFKATFFPLSNVKVTIKGTKSNLMEVTERKDMVIKTKVIS